MRIRPYRSAPQRLYTLPELVEVTGRSYDFWDGEVRAGRLRAIQPAGEWGARYVSAADYEEWFEASVLRVPDDGELQDLREVRGDQSFDFEP